MYWPPFVALHDANIAPCNAKSRRDRAGCRHAFGCWYVSVLFNFSSTSQRCSITTVSLIYHEAQYLFFLGVITSTSLWETHIPDFYLRRTRPDQLISSRLDLKVSNEHGRASSLAKAGLCRLAIWAKNSPVFPARLRDWCHWGSWLMEGGMQVSMLARM